VTVTGKDGSSMQTYRATVVGADPDKDVAVLKIELPSDPKLSLSPVKVGTSSSLKVNTIS
jgi:S1-C subfamily serine protease